MNQLLYSRSLGSLGPHAFARLQTAQLIHAIQPCPRLQFDGGEKEVALPDDEDDDEGAQVETTLKLWAHQAGANALALDVDGRL
jgi:DNA excision repair protein ERCC-8